MLRIAIAAALCLSVIPHALAAGDAERGRLLVERSCSSCHAPAGSPATNDAAPSFSTIAANNRGGEWVRAWLLGTHPPMQGIDLSRQQVEDVIAYLKTIPAE